MFLRRLFGIEVSRSFDVSEEGIEGKLTEINPDGHDWLKKVSDNNGNNFANCRQWRQRR